MIIANNTKHRTTSYIINNYRQLSNINQLLGCNYPFFVWLWDDGIIMKEIVVSLLEDTDDETDNDQPSQVESNDVKIKKENYGSYDDETDNEELPEKVKSNLDVKIEEEDTDNEWVEGYATSYQSVSWLNYLFRVVVNLSKERINYQMAAVGGIRIEFFCCSRGEYYVMQIGLCFLFCNIYDRCRG